MNTQPPPLKSEKNRFKDKLTLKFLVLGILLLIMLIPLAFVKSLIREREDRETEVVQEINNKWGESVTISGPILEIPYIKEETTILKSNGEEYTNTYSAEDYLYVFPNMLDIKGEVNAKTLKRSLFESIVYTSDIKIKGNFDLSEVKTIDDIGIDNIEWDKIKILFKTSNVKGISKSVHIRIFNNSYELLPIYSDDNTNNDFDYRMYSLYSDKIGLKSASDFLSKTDFDIDFAVNGSNSISFVPIGKKTNVSLTSNWHSPSFDGNYLPNTENKKISKDGFTAEWQVLQTNRQFEQVFKGTTPNLSKYAFGVSLINPVNDYTKSERATKYGILVIGLTLLVLLLIQITSKIYMHPFQYILIAFALIMFYTLLVSISEQSTFLIAYLIASIAVIGLITTYIATILRNKKYTILVSGTLVGLYAFIYTIIQLEDYALIAGSIGLFIILAAVMFITKKINWDKQ